MGNQACSLPEGAAGDALRTMVGAKRIPIADRFWFELLKVQLPSIEQPGFFDALYKKPEALDGLVHTAYFLQLVATNECTGNFRTLLRFWSRLLHYYRTSPRDAKPCSAATLLSLSLLCRCLLKHFAGTFIAPLLIFQLEQTPYETAAETEGLPKTSNGSPKDDDRDEETKELEAALVRSVGVKKTERLPLDDGQVFVSYCGRKVLVRLNVAMGAGSGGIASDGTSSASAFLRPLQRHFPHDAAALGCVERCAVRVPGDGDTFAAADAAERVAETGAQELVVCPSKVPAARGSVLRGVFREIADFLVSSSLGAVSGATPAAREDGEVDAADGNHAPRNLSVAPRTMQLQAILLEILLALSAVMSPRYGPSGSGSADEWKVSRVDFSAPLLFSCPERFGPPPAPGANASVGASAGSAANGADRGDKAEGAPNGGTEAEDLDAEPPAPHVLQRPIKGEMAPLPLLSALLETLEEDEEDGGAADVVPAGAVGAEDLQFGPRAEDGRPRPGGGARRAGSRAEALVATLLNFIWLEAHAASLPQPSRELLGLIRCAAPAASSGGDAADPPPASADKRSMASEAAGAGRHIAARTTVVLLLLLLHDAQEHPLMARAIAGLTDPSLDSGGGDEGRNGGGSDGGGRGSPAHLAGAACVNFTQLAQTLLGRLQESVYALLFYCLVQRNAAFRRHCVARVDAESLLVPILELLNQVPGGAPGAAAQPEAGPSMAPEAPPVATALLLSLLALTSDAGFCAAASRKTLADGNRVLGHARPVRDAALSSLMIAVLFRLAHWNFASCRSAFLNRAVAGCLANLAVNGVERLHWHVAGRLIELTQLLARNALRGKVSQDEPAAVGDSAAAATAAADRHRTMMVRQILAAAARLISSCLQGSRVAKNGNLLYALQRAYPAQFIALETDQELGPALRHVRTAVDWFQAQCPPGDGEGGADDSDVQVARLESAAARLPSSVDLLSAACGRSRFAFSETGSAAAFFMPEVWREAKRLTPDHVCWTLPRTMRPV